MEQKYFSALRSNNRIIVTTTQHQVPNNTKVTKTTYDQSTNGTQTYYNNLNRAFNHVKNIVFFNPDMTNFITLTYRENIQDVSKVQRDIKQLVKYTKKQRARAAQRGGSNPPEDNLIPKYVYVLEYQKRGALHVHMIANDFFLTGKNKHGYLDIKYWSHGFTNVRRLDEFDTNFKPYLYMFKYMTKAERIGKRFIYTSRGLVNFSKVDYDIVKPIVKEKTPIHTYEAEFITPNNNKLITIKEYYTYG